MFSNLSNPSADAVFPADFALAAFRFRLPVRMLHLAVVEATSCEAGLRFWPIHCEAHCWQIQIFWESDLMLWPTCQLLHKTEYRTSSIDQFFRAALEMIFQIIQNIKIKFRERFVTVNSPKCWSASQASGCGFPGFGTPLHFKHWRPGWGVGFGVGLGVGFGVGLLGVGFGDGPGLGFTVELLISNWLQPSQPHEQMVIWKLRCHWKRSYSLNTFCGGWSLVSTSTHTAPPTGGSGKFHWGGGYWILTQPRRIKLGSDAACIVKQ